MRNVTPPIPSHSIAEQAGAGAHAAIREQKKRYIAARVVGIDPDAEWTEGGPGMRGGPLAAARCAFMNVLSIIRVPPWLPGGTSSWNIRAKIPIRDQQENRSYRVL